MRIPIVNEQDELIEYREKKDIGPNDINRDTGLWILNEFGEILLGQRSANKKLAPNLWTVAVAGTVEEGETYESNVIKEAYEEIGLKDIKPQFLFTLLKQQAHRRMSGSFKITIPKDTKLTLEPKEVSEVRWFSLKEIHELLATKPDMFTPSFGFYLEKFLEYENKS